MSLYYISTQPFSTICKHHHKMISEENIRHVWNVMSIVGEQDWGGCMWEKALLSVLLICWSLLMPMFWWAWAVKVKELKTLVGSEIFQAWKLSPWKPYLCPVTHSYSDKLVLGRIQYFITNIWCIGCAQIFNLAILLYQIPIPTHDEMSVGSVEKCTKHLQDLK